MVLSAALVRQNVMVQIRDQQVLIRQRGRIVPRYTLQAAHQRSRQVVAGHWAGLVPLRGCCGGGGLMPRSTQQIPTPSRPGMTAAEPAEIQLLVEDLDYLDCRRWRSRSSSGGCRLRSPWLPRSG